MKLNTMPMWLFLATGPLLALYQWQNAGFIPVIGSIPPRVLIATPLMGGAISFALYLEGVTRWVGLIPGALAGGGAFGVPFFYATAFQLDRIHKLEFLVTTAVGTAPGVLLCWALLKLFGKAERAPRRTRDESNSISSSPG